jgi:hypothetical protein
MIAVMVMSVKIQKKILKEVYSFNDKITDGNNKQNGDQMIEISEQRCGYEWLEIIQ